MAKYIGRGNPYRRRSTSTNSIESKDIQDGAVTADKLAPGAVTEYTHPATHPASILTGALPAIDGSSLTGIVSIPTGLISMWSGSASAIPSGWNLCDGNNGTPNLVGKFIKGGSTAGTTGGSGTTSNTGSHNHSGASHTHGTSYHTLSTAQMPAHKHKFKATEGGGSYGGHISILAGSGWGGGSGAGDVRQYYTNSNSNIGSSGSHTHGNTTAGGTGTTSSNGSHTHTIEPVHYTLCYIMKS